MPAMLRTKEALRIVNKILKNNPSEMRQTTQKQENSRAENPYMREMRMTIKR